MKRLYVAVRPDIPVGLQMAQACHAVREFTLYSDADVGDNLVVLHVPVDEIDCLCKRAAELGISYQDFREPDLGGQLTAAAFAGEARKLLSSFPLACRSYYMRLPEIADSPELSVLTD